MENAIYNFFQILWNEWLSPFINSFFGFISDTFNADNDFFTIFFNWLFNIGRETPVEYFTQDSSYTAVFFAQDIVEIFFMILSIILMYKLIKIIFKPIFKLFNVGGDIKWRR